MAVNLLSFFFFALIFLKEIILFEKNDPLIPSYEVLKLTIWRNIASLFPFFWQDLDKQTGHSDTLVEFKIEKL